MNRLILILLLLLTGTVSTLQSIHLSAAVLIPLEASSDSGEPIEDQSTSDCILQTEKILSYLPIKSDASQGSESEKAASSAYELHLIRAPPVPR